MLVFGSQVGVQIALPHIKRLASQMQDAACLGRGSQKIAAQY